jgi:hypothetical protein
VREAAASLPDEGEEEMIEDNIEPMTDTGIPDEEDKAVPVGEINDK